MIKKIFVNSDEKSIVVVRDGVVKEYKGLSEIDFRKVYSKLVAELKESNSKYQSISDVRALVIEMRNDGLIKFLEKEDLISEIIYNEEENKLVVNYYSGNSEVVEEYDDLDDAYEQKVDLVCKQYGLTEEELEKIGVIKVKENSKLAEVVQTTKVKNLITKKRLIALALGAALVATGFGISELKNKKSDGSKDNENDSVIETTISPNPNPTPEEIAAVAVEEIPTPEPTVVPTAVPTPEPTAVPTEVPNIQADISFTEDPFILDAEQIAVEIYPGSYTIRSYGEENYENLKTLESHSFENMSDLASHIQNPSGNPELTTVGKMIYYEKFYGDLNDRGLIRHFNNYRNEIIWQAFAKNDINKARFYINEANREAVRVIYDGNPVKVEINGETRYVYFNDLTQDAKDTLLNIAWSMYTALAKDNFSYEDEIYNQDLIAERVFGIEPQKSK